jgi:hypothetical protein
LIWVRVRLVPVPAERGCVVLTQPTTHLKAAYDALCGIVFKRPAVTVSSKDAAQSLWSFVDPLSPVPTHLCQTAFGIPPGFYYPFYKTSSEGFNIMEFPLDSDAPKPPGPPGSVGPPESRSLKRRAISRTGKLSLVPLVLCWRLAHVFDKLNA